MKSVRIVMWSIAKERLWHFRTLVRTLMRSDFMANDGVISL